MFDPLCEINICDIDLEDERYKISLSADDIIFLAQSIKEAGLIVPPIVRPLNDRFIVISGFNRIKALMHNNETTLVVHPTKPDISDCQCVITSIASHAFNTPLSHAELSISIRRLCQYMDKEQIAKKSSAIFNIELNARFVEELLTISALPDPTLQLIHHGNLSLKSAKRISFLEKETLKMFLTLFSKINASSSKQLEIIQFIFEILARDQIEPRALFYNSDIEKILMDEYTDPVLKTNRLRSCLFEKRFPTIFNTRQMIQKKITSIKMGGSIKFLPPENFESQNYSISFTAKNHKEYAAHIQTLNETLENRALRDIFNS